MNIFYDTLVPFGLTQSEAETVIGRFGLYGAMDLLTVCPYRLALEGIDFRTIDRYVMNKSGIDPLCPSRLSQALIYTLHMCEKGASRSAEDSSSEFDNLIMQAAGSTCIPKSRIYDFLEELLELEEGAIDQPLLDKSIKYLSLMGQISVNRLDDRIFLALADTYRAEKEAADHVRAMLASSAPVRRRRRMYRAIDTAMACTGKILSQEQKNAVSMILQNRFSVLTGGPGTGKTQTELVLIKALQILDPNASVRCIAPTGQAARRMTDATGCPATTIHKALGIVPGIKAADKNTVLSETLVICDEASMIDSYIFRDLMVSLSEHTSIVFVGDVAQLPSVGAGNVLAELIASDSVPVTRLTKIFRQGDNSIAFNCAKIQAGNARLDLDSSFQFIERSSSGAIKKEVVSLYEQEVRKNGLDSVVVLTPFRHSTKTGVNSLNRALRKVVSDSDNSSYCENSIGIRIYTGDKITFLRNRNGLVNGETGTAVKCYPGTAVCRFGEKELTLKGDELDWIEPAFAQTVHKSQGLEYPTCIIVLDEKHSVMLSKQIIYTAISRCKQTCVCVGQVSMLNRAITAEGFNVRTSCLSALIDNINGKEVQIYA